MCVSAPHLNGRYEWHKVSSQLASNQREQPQRHLGAGRSPGSPNGLYFAHLPGEKSSLNIVRMEILQGDLRNEPDLMIVGIIY